MAGTRHARNGLAVVMLALGIGAMLPGVAAAATADVSIVKTDNADPVTEGTELIYTLAVTNAGPDTATAVTTEDKLPNQTDFVAFTSSQGTCAEKGRSITCELGSLTSGADATVAIRLIPRRQGQLSNTATVATSDTDPQQANNSDTETTTVIAPPAAPTCAGLEATVVGTTGPDALTGTNGRDVIAGLGGNDVIRGLDGNDTICAAAGDDRLRGGDGKDNLRGGGGGDRLAGGRGDDLLRGGGGPDICRGGAGRDTKRSC